MSFNLLKKIIVILLCGTFVAACTMPPKRQSPVSAQQLANRHLEQPYASGLNQPSSSSPIVELPRTQSQPLTEVNKIGKTLSTETLTDKTQKNSDFDLSNDQPITLDFEQTELRTILDLIAHQLNINIVIDPTIAKKVTVRSAPDKPLKKEDLWPLLQLLLHDAGAIVEKKGKVYHFKKLAPTLPGTIGMKSEILTSSDSPDVLQITPLRYIPAESIQAVINPLIQPKGRIITLPTLNVIGIVTTPQRLGRVNKLLEIIDADPFLHRGMRLFRLINSKASEVQADLDKILKALYGNKTPPTYYVLALERINAILVIAPPNSGFNEVALWVDILDERAEEGGEQIFIYKVKNLEATKLASTLSNVFKIEDKKEAEEKRKREAMKPKDDKDKTQAPIVPGKMAVSAEIQVTIVADESTNSLLIRASPRDYRQLLETIYVLDQVPKEVMVNIVIAEVTLNDESKFGIDWQFFFGGERFFGTGESQRSYVQSKFPISNTSGLSVNYVTGNINGILNMVSSTNNVTILARPSLLVRNNEKASIHVGSEEPFMGSIQRSSNPNEPTFQDIQYKDTGVNVELTPRINDDGIINLEINQELIRLGELRDGRRAFGQRKIVTSVVVRDSTAVVIGGLIKVDIKNDQNGITGLQDLPLIGNILFSSTTKKNTRTELVLIIVPQIVNPEADNRPIVRDFLQRMQVVSQLLNAEHVFMDKLSVPVPPPQKPVNTEPSVKQPAAK
ncbi:type II secretion system secretin GspD [Candidatus Parabeggiatoa sp. HSG14]|uniref:type II secretion system secretin GspD n=1 Tax=Candidatus Parabeggiatoa sp. HSG14 TaxID=3055593 RepID=UPI0025A75AC8|nr:type II secretion system secretin GspD [Thiotrichales bacterium HSG14]